MFNRPSKALIVLSVLFFAAAYTFFAAAYPTWHKYERLAHVGVRKSARIIAKERANHAGLRYRYDVGNDAYDGVTPAGMWGLPDFDAVKIGDSLMVVYWPEHPDVSSAGDAMQSYGSWSFLLFVVLPVLAAIGALTMAAYGKRVTLTTNAKERRIV
jgi:hypothetical protein